MNQKLILICLLINLSFSFARVPSRTHETEETPTAVENDRPKVESSAEPSEPVERTPAVEDDDSSLNKPKKPISVILFRTQPRISIFRDRSPFDSPAFHPLGHPHFAFSNPGTFQNDPALRLLSILFGDRLRPMQPETEIEAVNGSSSESSAESSETDRRAEHPFESLFPSIFVPRFPMDSEKDAESTTNQEDKTAPANFEKKEKKVIDLGGGRRFVKTTQTKKVKNDFGEFHSVISSYQPFDEKIHDENGNDKVNPEENKNDKKDVESTTSSSKPDFSSTFDAESVVPSSTKAPEEEAKPSELDIKESEDKKLSSESFSKVDESKNEIPDKNAEIKVDQMN